MRGVNEVFASGRDRGRIYRYCEQLVCFGFGFGIQSLESDLGYHHMAARSPAQGNCWRTEYQADDANGGYALEATTIVSVLDFHWKFSFGGE